MIKRLSAPGVLFIVRILIGSVFIISAIAKLMSIGQFEIIMIQQEIIDNRETAAYLARFITAFELGLGLCYFQKFCLRSLIIPVTLAMLAVFTIHLGYLMMFTDYSENCGCFGELMKMTPLEAIVKNIIFMVLAGYLFRFANESPSRWYVPSAIIAATVLTVMVAFPVAVITKKATASEQQSVAGNTTRKGKNSRFSVFRNFKNTPNNVSITSGSCLVAFLSLECEHCMEVAAILADMSNRIDVPIYAVYLGDERLVESFSEETYSNFPYVIPPASTFFDFIGNAPPRVYYLTNGAMITFWDMNDFSYDSVYQAVQGEPK